MMLLAFAFLAAPDLILQNGKIWTGRSEPRFVEAVAITGDLIVAAGSSEDIAAIKGAQTRVIDLRRRLATPGFIDNHAHFTAGGFRLEEVQLRDASTPEEFARRIREYAGRHREGTWITGGDWDHERWDPVRLPAKELIDKVTPAHPVFVTRLDGHMGLANSVALRMAGITRETPDPPGGTIVRDANGEPTGILKDTAMDPVFEKIPDPSAKERLVAARAAVGEAARVGLTALCDMAMGDDAFEDLRAYQQIEREGELTTRISLYVPLASWKRLADAGIERNFGGPRLRIGGLKGFSDGSLGSSTAWFNQPYLDQPDTRGLSMESLTNGQMKQQVREASDAGLQIAIHAIGDRANEEVLAIMESVPDFTGRRFRIEHAQHLNDPLVRRFARDKVIASMQPYHAIDDGRWAERKIGRERAKYTYAFRSLIDAGAVLTFGSDWFVAPLDPIQGIYAAVTRRTIDGKNPGGWVPEQKITVEEALRAYTVNNAYAMFRENELGTIAPGMLADIVVLSDDLFTIAPEKIENVKVDVTIAGGKVVFTRE
jgi:predicted amidohydrolase YtcJ